MYRLYCITKFHLIKYLLFFTSSLTLFHFFYFVPEIHNSPKDQKETYLTPETTFLIHFVWIENRRSKYPYDITVMQYFSFLSAIHYKTANTIIWFHTNGNFSGPYWSAVNRHIVVKPIQRYVTIGKDNRPVKVIEQEADILKLNIAKNFGGFFVDFDVYYTGSISPIISLLTKYECVFREVKMKRWTLFHMGNFACNQNSEFLKEIYRDYQEDYRGNCYNKISAVYNGCLYAALLYAKSEKFKRTVFVDKGQLLGQFEKEDGYAFRLSPNRVPWDGHVNIHSGDEQDELNYRTIWLRNTSVGDMLRNLIFDTSRTVTTKNIIGGSPVQCAIAKCLTLQYYLKTQSGLPDLTNLEYLSVLSAIKFAKPKTIVLVTSEFRDLEYGPLMRHLQEKASSKIVVEMDSNTHGAFGNESGSHKSAHFQTIFQNQSRTGSGITLDVDSKTVFLPKTVLDRRRVLDLEPREQKKDGRFNTFPRPIPHRKLFHRVKLSSPGFNDTGQIGAVQIPDYERERAFGVIRKLPSRFGRLARFILYDDPTIVHEQLIHKFPC